MPDKLFIMLDIKRYMSEKRAQVDVALDRYLPAETERPSTLHKAMRYSIFCGGKRLRPILCLASSESAGGSGDAAMLAAAALECLHTYTLIHDDLPSMDNDDLRRGQPTSHKVFGEANAILAGDSLLTLAFELLAQAPQGARLALELARSAGSRGVAGGQFEDLAAEGKKPDTALVEFIHVHKTAKLIQAACRMGGIAAGVNEAGLAALDRYGERIGLAFQVADDVLNATSTPETLGKAVGSDAIREKMTYVSLVGVEQARRVAAGMADEAIAALTHLPGATEPLAALARFIVDRDM
jgi:geranylgeranyl diphosphate synthase type II